MNIWIIKLVAIIAPGMNRSGNALVKSSKGFDETFWMSAGQT